MLRRPSPCTCSLPRPRRVRSRVRSALRSRSSSRLAPAAPRPRSRRRRRRRTAAPGVPAAPPRVVRVDPMSGGGATKPAGLAALEEELQRGMRELGGKGKPPPYYIAYEVHDRNDVTVAASYGALVQSSTRRARILDTDVRVGDYKLDSTHAIRSNDFDFSSVIGGHPVALPLSDDPTRAAHGRLARDRSPLQRGGRAAGEDPDPAHAQGRRRRSLRRLLAREAGQLPRAARGADRRRPGLGAADPRSCRRASAARPRSSTRA